MKSRQQVIHCGECHCGRVRFEVRGPAEIDAVRCNCTICRKSGFVGWIVPAPDFRLRAGAEALNEYRFNTGIARHLFCRYCGVKPFYVPRSHPHGYSVNIHCLNEQTINGIRISEFDGKNWEASIHALADISRD